MAIIEVVIWAFIFGYCVGVTHARELYNNVYSKYAFDGRLAKQKDKFIDQTMIVDTSIWLVYCLNLGSKYQYCVYN